MIKKCLNYDLFDFYDGCDLNYYLNLNYKKPAKLQFKKGYYTEGVYFNFK
jgi:hypothetical protein